MNNEDGSYPRNLVVKTENNGKLHTVLVRGEWDLQEENSKVEIPLQRKVAREGLCRRVVPEHRAESMLKVDNKR